MDGGNSVPFLLIKQWNLARPQRPAARVTMHAPDEHADAANESHSWYPSGPWTGFFVQPVLSGRHWMELSLTFRDGQIRGDGRDWVGSFLIRGRYDQQEGKCWWTKSYLGKHDVAYVGYNEGKGIWGTWEMKSPAWKGGFHIWPKGMGLGAGNVLAEEEELPDEQGGIIFEDVSTLQPAGIDDE